MQERRYSFIDGAVAALPQRAPAHECVRQNILAHATRRLRGSGCEPSRLPLVTGNGNVRHPDMTIDCGPMEPDARIAGIPVAVFEVVPDTMGAVPVLLTLRDYAATPVIRHYVLIDLGTPRVLVYQRDIDGVFSLRPLDVRSLDAVLDLPSIGLKMPLADIYRGSA